MTSPSLTTAMETPGTACCFSNAGTSLSNSLSKLSLPARVIWRLQPLASSATEQTRLSHRGITKAIGEPLLSFALERDHRIHLHRPQRRNPAGRQRDAD